MWNCRKCEVRGTTGGVKYVNLEEIRGTTGSVKYVELQEV